MQYRSHTPPPPLRGFVDYFWSLRDTPQHARERIVPSGTLELVFNLREDEVRIYDPAQGDRCNRFSGGVVSGAYRTFFGIDTREHAEIVGVHFRSGGAFPFLGVATRELADRHVDLEVLWGRSAVELREQLCEATTPDARFRLLEEALLAHLTLPLGHRNAVRAAIDHLGAADVAVREVAERVGLSHRRFIQVFAEETGMTPKLFARVRRFQRAISLAGQAPTVNWARLAADCGYFDQSHLIRDFVAFSGLTPADYLRWRTPHVKDLHVAVT